MIARRALPRQATPFIGRERELDGLLVLLAQPAARLVTIVAPGGMGKTRLALAAAEQCRDEETFPDGVAFAALAPLGDPASLEATLADALGLPLGAGDPRPLGPSCSTICARKKCCWCSTTASTWPMRSRGWRAPSWPRPRA